MLLALMLALHLADWVPARWVSADVASLSLLEQGPVNCLLVEKEHWSAGFAAEARQRNLTVLGVIRPEADLESAVHELREAGLAGVVLEGDFPEGAAGRIGELLGQAGAPVIELQPRRSMRFTGGEGILGTYQGVWPGIEEPKPGEHKAGPTGAPWVFTNGGFLRYLAAVHQGPVWIAQSPPADRPLKPVSYLQAIGDAASVGARWVLAFQDSFWEPLLAGDPEALADWRRIVQTLDFYEKQRAWGRIRPLSNLAVIQDADSGALYSGGILDMLATKHYPLHIVPPGKLSESELAEAKIVVNVDAQALSEEQVATLRGFARRGGILFTGPPQARLSRLEDDRITVDEEKLEKIDQLWKGVNSMLWQAHVGARLYNVSGMLSSLLALEDGTRIVLHLINYTGYPVENVVAALKGTFGKATLHVPGKPPAVLELYDGQGGKEAEIETVDVIATLVME